jgi:hypothetical protein
MLRMPALALRSCSAVRRTTVFAATLALVLGALSLTAQAYSLGHLPGYFIPQKYFKHGAVYTRAMVLSAAGKPIWVEYGSDGKEGREIGEASGQYQSAKVMAGDVYRAYLQRQREVRERYPTAEVMTRAAYNSKTFKTVTGETIAKPGLESASLTVMVRADKELFSTTGYDLLLLEMPIKDGVTPDASSKSLLLASDGSILHQTVNTIGFRVGFFGKDEQVSTGFSRDRDAKIYGPMPGVVVGVGGWGFFGGGVSDKDGKYSFSYWLPPCPGFEFSFTTPLTLELRYKRFSPRGSSMMPYYMSRPDYDYCNGLGVWDLNAANIIASAATPVKPNLDFPVDLMVLDASAKLEKVKVGGDTTYSAETSEKEHFLQEKYDFDGDEKPDFVVPGKKVKKDVEGVEKVVFVKTSTADAELQGIYLSSKYSSVPDNTEEKAPDFTRLIDTAADFKDRGLLEEISEDDLKDTDIYVFREATGQLVAERRGLKDQEINNSSGLDEKNDAFRFTIQLRGSVESLYNDTARGDVAFKKWQTTGGFKEEFQKRTANHLKAGEQVRLIAINRPTGYVGSKVVPLKTALNGNAISLNSTTIVLKAPNLKVWAERKSKIEKGLTKGTDKKQLISNEGAGLGSDVSIAIYTDWRDADGTAFPEELADYGYTGRLAKIVAANQLAPVGANSLSQFKIKPGQQVQVIQLPEQVLAKQHLYLQVAGQPENRNPDFSSEGSGSGILEYRPSHYVPVQVPLHDEEASELARQAYRKAIKQFPEQTFKAPQPLYAWKYRPEMQFSLYELNVSAIRKTDSDKTVTDILEEAKPRIESSVDYVSVVYNLLKSSLGTLDAYSYDKERQMVLALGGEEIKATIGKAQNIVFDNIEHLASLGSNDFLTIRLFANNDAGNLLWEFGFNTELQGQAPVNYISADTREVELVTYVAVDSEENDPKKIKVHWSVSDGGKLQESITESTDGVFHNTLTASKVAGAVHTVTARVVESEDSRVRTGSEVVMEPMAVVAGAPTRVEVTSDSASLLSTGVDTATLTATVYDQHDNPAQEGTPVAWDTGYSGDLDKVVTQVDAQGVATAQYRVGLETLPTDVSLSAGAVAEKTTVEKKAFDFTATLSASSFEPGSSGVVTVTLSEAPEEALDINWSNSSGPVSGPAVTQGTTMQASFQVGGDSSSDGHVAVNIAGVVKDLPYSITPSDPEGTIKFDYAAVASGNQGSYSVETLNSSTEQPVVNSTNATVHGKPHTTVTLSAGGFFTQNFAPIALFPMSGFDVDAQGNQVLLDTLGGLSGRVEGRVSWDESDSYFRPGSSMRFDGGKLVVLDNDSLDFNTDYYANIRFKVASITDGAVLLRKGSNDSSGYELKVVVVDNVVRLQARVSTDQGDFTVLSSTPIQVGAWYLAGVQLKSGALTLGVGAARDTAPAPGVPNNSGFANNLVVGQGFDGNINELKLGQIHASRGSLVLIDGETEKQITFDKDGKAKVSISGGTAKLNSLGARVGFSVQTDSGVAKSEIKELRYQKFFSRFSFTNDPMGKVYADSIQQANENEGGVAVVDGQSMAEAIEMLKKAGKPALDAIKTAAQFLFEMTSISDVWQLTKAVYLWTNGRFNEVDKIELAFAGIGLTLTIVTVVTSVGTVGAGAPGSIAAMVSVKGALKVLKATLKDIFLKEPGQILKIGGTVARWSFDLVGNLLTGKAGREAAVKQLVDFKDLFVDLIKSGSVATWNLLKNIGKSPKGFIAFLNIRKLNKLPCSVSATDYPQDRLYARLVLLDLAIPQAHAAPMCGAALSEKIAAAVDAAKMSDAEAKLFSDITVLATRADSTLDGLRFTAQTVDDLAKFVKEGHGENILQFMKNMEEGAGNMKAFSFEKMSKVGADGLTPFDVLMDAMKYVPKEAQGTAFKNLAIANVSNVRGVYGEAATFKRLHNNPNIPRELPADGSITVGKDLQVGPNVDAGKNASNVQGLDIEGTVLQGTNSSGGPFLAEVKNYTSSYKLDDLSKQVKKHFESRIFAMIEKNGWQSGKPHLHFEWMGSGFGKDVSVRNRKDAVIKMCNDMMALKPRVKPKFDCAKDITFNVVDDFIDPLTTKAAN